MWHLAGIVNYATCIGQVQSQEEKRKRKDTLAAIGHQQGENIPDGWIKGRKMKNNAGLV